MPIPAQFLSTVLPSQGTWIFAHIAPFDPATGKRSTHHSVHSSLADLEKYVAWAASLSMDSYVAIAGFGAKQHIITKGKRMGQAELSRAADNAEWHRCMRIDIDVSTDPSKSPYATKKDAWFALRGFLTAAQLPMPLLVDSGYGVHVYWPFDADIPAERWHPLVAKLAAAMHHFGLIVDTTATEDAARVLRLPGTLNYKNGTTAEVKVLHWGANPLPVELYEQQLAPYQATHINVAGVAPRGARGLTSELEAGMHPAYSMQGVLKQCPGLLAMFTNGGATAREPLWHAALATVNKSADTPDVKERVARALSKGHPGFNDAEFLMKWGQVQQQNYEPPTCAKFTALGMPECRGCPLAVTHKSPVVLGRPQPTLVPSTAAIQPAFTPVQPAPASIASPPVLGTAVGATMAVAAPSVQGVFQWFANDPVTHIIDGPLTGRLAIRGNVPCTVEVVEDAAGNKTQVAKQVGKYQFVSFERLLDTQGTQSLVALTINRHTDGYARVELSHKELHDSRAFASSLYAAGVYYTPRDMKIIVEQFMPEFLTQLQAIRQAHSIASRCGWTPDHTKFVLGTTIYSAAGSEPSRPGSATDEIEAYHQEGDYAAWRAAYDLCLASDPERQAVLALGIAAPLMAFTGVDGVLLNAWSPESGVGKSTLCDAVLSVWGSPKRLRKDFRDTPAATFHLAGVSGNMPMVVDEFTNVEGKALSDYVYTITQGRERHRMSSDAKVRANANRWCLAAIATSNSSVHGKLQAFRQDATAEAARVFELRIHPVQIDPALMGNAKETLSGLVRNYGFLGPQLVQMFMTKGAAYWRDVVTKRIAWWDAQMANDTGDRFRSVTAALVEIGAKIGNAMGFAFDPAAVVDAIQRSWAQQMAEFEATRATPENFVTDYLMDNIQNLTVIVDSMTRSDPMHEFVGEIHGTQVNQTTMQPKEIMIPTKLLRTYIEERNGNYRAFIEWAQRQVTAQGLVLEYGQMTFARGTIKSMRVTGFRFSAAIMGVQTINIAPPAQTTPSNVTPITARAKSP